MTTTTETQAKKTYTTLEIKRKFEIGFLRGRYTGPAEFEIVSPLIDYIDAEWAAKYVELLNAGCKLCKSVKSFKIEQDGTRVRFSTVMAVGTRGDADMEYASIWRMAECIAANMMGYKVKSVCIAK